MGSNRYGDEFHQFLVANACARIGVKEGAVNLTLFAPPGMFVEARKTMTERFLENGGNVEITLKADKKPRLFHYEAVNVWPEGIGAAACFIVDEHGALQKNDVLNGETVILDTGAHTLDALKMVDGKFNPEELEHATWDTGGLHLHIREPILRTLKNKSDDFANLTVDDVDRIIRNGLVSGDYTLRAAGLEVNIEPLLAKYAERYAEWIANNVCDGVFGSFKGIKSVILVGGGTPLIAHHMQKWYGNKLLDPKKYDITRKIHPVDFNAIGGLRLALMRKQQAANSKP